MFHLLVGIGKGIVKSIEMGASELKLKSPSSSSSSSTASTTGTSVIPDALLITDSHDDHVKELPALVNQVRQDYKSKENLKIFCTLECRDQIIKKFPQLSEKTNDGNNDVSFILIQPDMPFQVGPFSIIPILAGHGDNSLDSSVIYIVKLLDKKIIIA